MLKSVSAGALIEGVKRARRNTSPTMREGFREGRAHWGVLFRIAALFGADAEPLDEPAVLRLVEQARAGDRAARQRRRSSACSRRTCARLIKVDPVASLGFAAVGAVSLVALTPVGWLAAWFVG